MKNSYLNGMFNFRVYLCDKKTKKKYIVNKSKKKRKIRKQYVKRFTIYTY
jgi:hypothetical protein